MIWSFSFFSLMLGLPFFADWHGWVSVVFTGLGALCLSIATFNQTKIVLKTRNTTGLVVKFMVFSCLTAVLLGGSSIADVITTSLIEWRVINAIFIVVNACSFVANALTYKKKKENMAAAEKAGMTEEEYYNRMILPTLDLEAKN